MIIAITGLIGTGKSTILSIFNNYDTITFSSDDYVHTIMNYPLIVEQIGQYFPSVIVNQSIDKQKLKDLVFENYATNIQYLEKIYHPFVRVKIKKMILLSKFIFNKHLILEVPVLFKSEIYKLCDIIILTTVDKSIHYRRLKNRNLTDDNIEVIINKQKLEIFYDQIDYIIDTSVDLQQLYSKIADLYYSFK